MKPETWAERRTLIIQLFSPISEDLFRKEVRIMHFLREGGSQVTHTAKQMQFSVILCYVSVDYVFFLQNVEAKSSGVSAFRAPVCNFAY
jgi:hypothetical protein